MKFTANLKGWLCLSDSGKTYQIHAVQKGEARVPVFCTCPAGKFAKSGNRECKHIRGLKAMQSMAAYSEKIIHNAPTLVDTTKLKKTTWTEAVIDEAVAVGVAVPKREPQRAEKYDGKPLPYPHYLEPKLDGLRALAFISDKGEITFKSRSMKPLYNTDVVVQELKGMGLKGLVIDGEMVGKDFTDSLSILKSSISLFGSDLLEHLKFVVFDILAMGEWERGECKYPLEKRREVLSKVFKRASKSLDSQGGAVDVTDELGLMRVVGKTGHELKHIRLIPYVTVAIKAEVEHWAHKFLERGFEGGMLKDPKAPYKCDRTVAWRKVKFVDDYDVVISGVQAGKGKHLGKLGAIEFHLTKVGKDGLTGHPAGEIIMEAGTGFSDKEREDLWALHQQGKLIGMIAEIGLQRRPGAGGNALFSVFRRMRPDKGGKP